jgi:hypothetical protein
MKTLTHLFARCGRLYAANLRGLRLCHATALATATLGLLAVPTARAGDCGTSVKVESRTEWRNSVSDVLSSIQLNPVYLPVSYWFRAAPALGDLLQNPDCAKLTLMGMSASTGGGGDTFNIKYSSLITSVGSTAAKFGGTGFSVNGVVNTLRPTLGPCGPPVIRSMVEFGGDIGVLVDHAGTGAYPRKINEGRFDLCRELAVLNNSGVAIEIPVSITGEIMVYGSFAIDSTYGKASLSLQGSIGGQSVSGKVELYETALDAGEFVRTINETRRVIIQPSPYPQAFQVNVSGLARCEVQAKGAGFMRLIMASAGATASLPGIAVGLPTGLGGSPLPPNVTVYDAEDGTVYVNSSASILIDYMPVPTQSPVWFFDQAFDAWLGLLQPSAYTATDYGETTVLSPPGMTAGLVRRADADADPLANVTNHNAFRLSFTVADTNTTPAVTVFIYDQPGGTPHALAYDLPLTPGYHEATLRYASGDASGRGVFTPGGPDLTRLHSIGIANTLFTNWPAQSALVTTGQLAVTFHHLAAFTAPPPGYEGFAITNSFLDTNRLLHLQYPASTNDYYLLYWGSQVTAVTNPIVMALGVDGAGEFFLTNLFATAFFQLLEVPLAQPLDVDGDGIDDLTEFRNPALYNPFVPATPIVTNEPPINPGTNAPSNSGQIYLWTLNNHRYMPVLVTNGVTWDEANAAATAVGGHLATLTSAAENDFVFGLIDRPEYWTIWPTNPPAASGPWLGGWQPAGAAEPAGSWRWLTPEPFDFTVWKTGAPDNAASPFGANEDCLAFASATANTRSNRWNDLPGALRLPGYVIEFDPPATSGDCIPRNGLLAWWKADGNALDSAGTNNGTLGSGQSYSASISGQAFQFDGVHDGVLIPDSPALNPTQQVTTVAWVYPSRDAGSGDWIAIIMADKSTFHMGRRNSAGCSIPTGNLAFTLGGVSGLPVENCAGWHDAGAQIPLGVWTCIALSYDGSAVRVFRNGVLVRTIPATGALDQIPGPLRVGSRATSPTVNARWAGMIDDVLIYDRALTADEIAGIYSGGITGRCKPQCVEPPAGLVAWWPGEGNANDIIGGNNGTLINGASFTNGIVGQAFSLDGASSLVSIPSSSSLNLGSAYTVCLWFFQKSAQPNGYRLMDKDTAGTGDGWQMDTYDGVTGRRLRMSGSYQANTVFTLNAWHHAAVTCDNGRLTLYLDGIPDGSFTDVPALPANNLNLYLGAAHGDPTLNFDGLIDEPMICSRALTAGEIAGIYMAGSAGFCQKTECPKVPTDLVAWWPADGNALDMVGTNHGSLQGSATFAPGKSGQAMQFNGAGEVIIADSSALRPSSLTIQAWVKPVFTSRPRVVADADCVLSKFNNSQEGYVFGIVQDPTYHYDDATSTFPKGTIVFHAGVNGAAHGVFSSMPVPDDGKFHHVAGSYDGGSFRVYLDGVAVGERSVAGNIAHSMGPAYVGFTPVNPRYSLASIDDVMLFRRALSASEIQALYQSATLPAPLLGHWSAEGNAQSTTANNHGTLAGGVTFASGVAGQAFNFNGVDGRVVVETPAGFPCASNWTLQVWAKPQLPQAAPALLAGQCLGPRLILLPDGRVQAAYDAPDQSSVTVISSRALSPCRFSQVVSIYDGASLRLFLDGELDAATPVAGKLAVITPCGFLMGGTDTNRFPCPCAQGFYHGLLDEVALYTRALFPAEVLANYTEFGPASSTPLLGHWPAEGNAQSTTAINHGTLAGGVTFAPGVAGQAFNFNGVSGRVVVAQPAGFQCASNWTLQTWASPQLPQAAPALLAGQCLGPRLVLLPDGRVQAAYDAADQSSVSVISSRALLPCQFSQVVSIYDGESLRLFLNGQLDAATPVDGKLAVVTECGFLMGGVDTNGFSCTCAQGFYSGLLDEVALYTRALVPAEVLANYSEFAPTNSTPPVSGPVVDHGGANWTLTAGTVLGGTHTNIGEFVIPSGVTASVMPFDGTNGGWTEIRAQRIRVDGTLNATAKGYPGGGGGGGGGGADQYQPGANGLGGAGYLGSSNGETGDDGGSTTGGGGGRGRPGLSSAYALFPGSGGSYGPGAADANAVNTGGNAQDGGYRASEANGDATTGEEVFIGCGGGGGGGGGGGHSLNCNSGGGGGGGGGAGGLGGGAVILRAVESLEISSSGAVYARGALGRNGTGGQAGQAYESTGNWQSPGGDGGNGASANGSNTGTGGAGGSKAQDVDGGKRLNWSGKGGTGGGGGAGAGGGILLRAPTVTVTGTINNSGGSSPNNGGTVKIYSTCGSSIVTNQITTGRLVTEGVSQGPGQPTAAVPYQSFNGAALQLYPWRGERVALLTPTADLDPAVMQRIVNSFDRVYDYYHAATGRTPQPARVLDGLSTIAVVPSTCGAGCAYLGSTGIEMLPEWFNTLYTGVRDRNQFDQVVFYEFGRNFWFYSPPLEYKAPENGGSVVTGYAVLMRFLSMEAVGASGGPFNGVPFSQFRQTVEGLVDTYTATPNLNWQNTLAIGLAPPNSMNLGGADLFASFVLRLRRDYGGEAFIRQLWPAAGNRPAASTTQQTVDNFIIAASVAANRNLTNLFTTQWRWPLSEAARAELAALFPSGG